MNNKNITYVSEQAFKFVEESEEIEGNFVEDCYLGTSFDRRTVSEFLYCDDTKVFVVKNKNGNYDLIATNDIANESIKISHIGDHFVALVNIVKKAKEKIKADKQNIDTPLLTHDFIKSINLQILSTRRDELGIGRYRDKDLLGRTMDVAISAEDTETGELRNLWCVQLESAENNNIQKQMDILINWANNTAFKNPDTYIEDIAKFAARFIKIHPFRDGNGRTSRLLVNYLMLVTKGMMVNIPASRKEEYNMALDYANASSSYFYILESIAYNEYHNQQIYKYGYRSDENKYLPLADLFEECAIKDPNKLIGRIINYRRHEDRDSFHAEQVKNK